MCCYAESRALNRKAPAKMYEAEMDDDEDCKDHTTDGDE